MEDGIAEALPHYKYSEFRLPIQMICALFHLKTDKFGHQRTKTDINGHWRFGMYYLCIVKLKFTPQSTQSSTEFFSYLRPKENKKTP